MGSFVFTCGVCQRVKRLEGVTEGERVCAECREELNVEREQQIRASKAPTTAGTAGAVRAGRQ